MQTKPQTERQPHLSKNIFPKAVASHSGIRYPIGILAGEGIGPSIINASLGLLKVIEAHFPVSFNLHWGGKIGKDAIEESGQPLSQEVIAFCKERFGQGAPVLCGPGGDRFVYDLRREFDLYCKLVPIRPLPSMASTGPLKSSAVADVDIVVVRENTGGLYQGDYGVEMKAGVRHAYHRFDYAEPQVARILEAGARLASQRRQRLYVVTKPGGAPSISRLWEEMAAISSRRHGVELKILEIDNACYQIIADASAFDVIVAPNLFGDVIADNAALLLGSRGMSFSANYSAAGSAVYQTGHGAAHDLAGKDSANPIGQMLSVSMLLRESFALEDIADEIRLAIDDTLAAGWRTADIACEGSRTVGTQALASMVCCRLGERLTAMAAPREFSAA
jgi:3-isopropylmalate dehydrogenase